MTDKEVGDLWEWHDAPSRLNILERGAHEAILKKANMFRPLIKVVEYDSTRIAWRTPRANEGRRNQE